MNFVIGDIHGELSKLKVLIKHINILDKSPTFIFIGDYLDKGENPFKTLVFLNEFSKTNQCVFLRGNHEYYWELLNSNDDQYAGYLLKYGGKNTIQSFGENLSPIDVKNKMMQMFKPFFSSLVNSFVNEQYVVTHSGIPAESYKNAIDEISPEKLFFNRYDFIKTQKLYFGKKIVFGHTGFYTPFYDGFKLGIDTCACYFENQPLTAFCIENEILINSENIQTPLTQISLNSCPNIPRIKPWRQIA